jgi:hypothetical protein
MQATANLVDNALKYSRDAMPPRLDITSEEFAAAYRITIADNHKESAGDGMKTWGGRFCWSKTIRWTWT